MQKPTATGYMPPSKIGHNPSQVSDTDDVAPELFGEGDYITDNERPNPPTVWIDPMPVREVASDHVAMATITVGQYSLGLQQIITRRGNNERRRVILRNLNPTTALIWLIAGDSAPPSPIVTEPITGTFIVPNGFALGTEPLEYTSAAPLWACHIETDTSLLAPLTIMFEGYFPSDRRS